MISLLLLSWWSFLIWLVLEISDCHHCYWRSELLLGSSTSCTERPQKNRGCHGPCHARADFMVAQGGNSWCNPIPRTPKNPQETGPTCLKKLTWTDSNTKPCLVVIVQQGQGMIECCIHCTSHRKLTFQHGLEMIFGVHNGGSVLPQSTSEEIEVRIMTQKVDNVWIWWTKINAPSCKSCSVVPGARMTRLTLQLVSSIQPTDGTQKMVWTRKKKHYSN